jgi:hypothetical protein
MNAPFVPPIAAETMARLVPGFVASRGYGPAWRSGCYCPGCARSNWIVGRLLAECAFCATALPIAEAA